MRPGFKLKTFVAGANVRPKDNDFVLIDECDEVYFSNLKWFEEKMSNPTMIGFTATTPFQQEMAENFILEKFFGIHIYDSQLKLKMREDKVET